MKIRTQTWLAGLLLLAATTAAPAATAAAQNDAPPGRVGRLSYLSGSVSLQVSGDSQWSDATINYPLYTGDRIYVDQGGRAEIEFGDITLRLSDASDVTITNVTDDLIQIGLSSGTIRLSVNALDSDDSLEVDTPGGPLVVNAPGTYRVGISPVRGTMVAVDRGALTIGSGSDATDVESGHAVTLSGQDTLEVSDIDMPREDDFDRWGADRDRGLVESRTAQYVDRSTPGYSDLDAAGEWIPDQNYGPVWYPTVVEAGWAPYRYGRWVWIEPWGWTWVESEPWGYAPFHYGRWVYVDSRWGWVPGPVVRHPCYAPALVVFVGLNNGYRDRGGVQAWFPLGPREPYNPWYHTNDRYRNRVNVDVNVTVVDYEHTRYANRDRGFTAVSSETFRGGVPVARRMVPVSNTQVTAARVIAHPQLMPTITAMRGRPAIAPPPPAVTDDRVRTIVHPIPVRRQPMITRTQPGQQDQQARPDQRPRQEPARPEQPQPQAQPAVQPLLRARRPAPPPDPGVQARQQAIEQHPGRPLEPQQIQNLRQGRPAGPMKDRETPQDVRPQARPQPQQRPQPPQQQQRPEPKKKDKPN